MASVILWLFAFAFTIPLTILRGYIIVSMWNWFVVTQFPQAPHISIAGAIGLAYFIALFQSIPESKDEKQSPGFAAVEMFGTLTKGGVVTLVIWGIGYIVHCYM